MNCSKCGYEITGNIKFCPKCGTPVEVAPEATDTPVEEVVETPEVEEAPEAEAPAAPEAEESASLFGDSTEPLFERNEGSIFEDAPVAENDVLGDAPTEELTPDAAPTAPVADPALIQQPAYAPEYIPEAPKKKFNKVWLIVIGAVILVGAIVALIFYNFRAAFSSPKSLMKNALVGYVEDTFDENQAYYDLRAQTLKDNGNQQVVDATVTLDDGFRDLLDNYDVDMDWLESAHIRMEVGSEGENSVGANIYGGVNGVDVISLLYLAQVDDKVFYMQLPELSKEYLGVDLSEVSDDDMSSAFASLDALSQMGQINSDDVKKLSVKYTKLVADELKDIDKDKDELEVDGVAADYYALTATIDQETAAAISVAVGEEVLEDQELKALMKIYFDYYSSNPMLVDSYGISTTDFEDWYDDFLDDVEDMVKEQKKNLKNFQKHHDGDLELAELIVYINSKGDLKGIELTPESADGKLYAYYPEDGDEFGMEIGFTDGYDETIITGSGTKSHDVINGEFTVKSDGEDILEIEVIDYDEGAYEKGHLIGEFIVRPGNDVDAGYDVATQMIANLEYDILFDSSKDTSKCSITIKNDSVSFATVNLEASYGDVELMEAPSNYYDLNDYDEEEKYFESMSFKELISKLKKAGVPESYIETLETYENYL
ncbi:MAG: zinc ribbon domain-containing protein [Pseudobutyrivibrio sp.]|nr:zinc ribbon domain-containing protein [Pseudobutyrivibrio sp.]